MDHPDRCRAATRRAALGLFSAIFLSAAAVGCSPADRAPGRTGGTRNRLEEMRALRGTGDPRRRGARSSAPPREKTHG